MMSNGFDCSICEYIPDFIGLGAFGGCPRIVVRFKRLKGSSNSICFSNSPGHLFRVGFLILNNKENKDEKT